MSNSETKFVYTVRNGENLELEYNSNFDFVVSKDGEQIHRSAEQTRIGGGAIDFVFPSDGQYTIIFDKLEIVNLLLHSPLLLANQLRIKRQYLTGLRIMQNGGLKDRLTIQHFFKEFNF